MSSGQTPGDEHNGSSMSHSPTAGKTPPSPMFPSKPRKQVGWAGPVKADATPDEIEPLGRPSDEYLRRELTRIMSSPQPSYPGLMASPESPQDPLQSSSTAYTKSKRTSEALKPAKPALRSGNITPSHATPPPEEDVQDMEAKKESAARAQLNAMKTWDDLRRPTSEQEELVQEERRGRSRRRPTSRFGWASFHRRARSESSEASTVPEHDEEGNYIEKPKTYLSGGLSALHLLQGLAKPYSQSAPSSADASRASSPNSSAAPRRRPGHAKSSSVASLIGASTGVATRPGMTRPVSSDYLPPFPSKPENRRLDTATGLINRVARPILGSRSNSWDEKQITVQKHIRELVLRQRYIVRLCRALMLYGAPTHRLEEYMKMTARVIEIKAQFLYVPGCMIMSFDDPSTHTAEIRLVKVAQGVDLGKMWDTHDVYKDVVHDLISVEDATTRLDAIMNKPDKFKMWFLVFMHGVASMSVAPFAFQADYIDLGPAFILGTILGLLRLVIAPASTLYTDIFEIVAVGITSFLARAFGSIYYSDGVTPIFCFSALAQSSIALILPGFHVLCGALELQSKSMVAGSVRLVYAVIFSLFVGFALTIGTAVYGFMDANANTDTQCTRSVDGYLVFPWVVIYTFSLVIINQAKWKHMPIMLVIAFAGYVVNFFSGRSFAGNTQLSSTLGAITISVSANLYSRVGSRLEKFFDFAFSWIALRTAPYMPRFFRQKVEENVSEVSSPATEREGDVEKQKDSRQSSIFAAIEWAKQAITNPKEVLTRDQEDKNDAEPASEVDGSGEKKDDKPKTTQPRHVNYSLAAAAMLPGIFVLVPSGIAVQGSLVQGIASANDIVTNATGRHSDTTTSSNIGNTDDLSLNVGYTVVQVAIGITVGLFVGSILVYPFGKGGRGSRGMRSGLFSF